MRPTTVASRSSSPTAAAASTRATWTSIFEEFARGRLAQDDGGTGLGLASVRELVTQMRGTVRIESEVGVGTTVTVDLLGGQLGALPAARASNGV